MLKVESNSNAAVAIAFAVARRRSFQRNVYDGLTEPDLMILQWFNARQASEAGAALADKLTPVAARMEKSDLAAGDTLPEIVKRARSEVRDLRLNFYQRAKLANAFKWKLIENGIERKVADEVTQSLVMDLSLNREAGATAPVDPGKYAASAGELLSKANRHVAQRDFTSAIDLYQQLLAADPNHTVALNNMGSALLDLGRFIEAEQHYRRALSIDPDFVDAHVNLGNVLRKRAHLAESEDSLRRAIKLKPNELDAHCGLGLTLLSGGRIHQAKGRLRKVLKSMPRNLVALHGMGEIALTEGRWQEAEKLFDRVLELEPNNASALAAKAGARKMTRDDAPWLEAAERVAASGISPPQEAALRYAIGKYFDDVGDFDRAFPSFTRANEMLKAAAEPYDRKGRARAAQDLMQAYTREALTRASVGGSDSTTPVFVVGMPRSGTSLVEQIIASHPQARGAGELEFWPKVKHEYESQILEGFLDEHARGELAKSYLRTLEEHAGSTSNDSSSVLRIVDKATVNSDYLGVIHSVFPKATIICMRRDPIDTCLSCYFQGFPLSLSYTLDLADLAHYYKEHRRIIAHWINVLPPGRILEVPYEALVADPEVWTRKIVGFIGLEWSPNCLKFHQTQRVVATASYRQVREEIYSTSVARWRNYEKFIGPLLSLRKS
jgi:tetratricopeptide (TPR) repeat protein